MVTWQDKLTLSEDQLDPEPHRQFATWLREAIDAGEPMANAMALATCDAAGLPAVRMVLFEDVDERGFTFQTNLESPKAQALAAVPRAAAVFFWPLLVRQVRVTGPVSVLGRDEVAAYFAAAPSAIQAMIRAAGIDCTSRRSSSGKADRIGSRIAFATRAMEPVGGSNAWCPRAHAARLIIGQ